MTTAPSTPARPRARRFVWIALIVIALVGPWVFSFIVMNGPGFTQEMVAAAPFYLIQSLFLSFIAFVFGVGALALIAELVLVRGAARDQRVWQALGVLVCIALAVMTVVGVIVPAMDWAWRS